MMSGKYFFGILFLLFFSACLPAQGLARDITLQLEDDNGKILKTAKISPDTGFAIRYTHSVALTPVTDYFIIRNGNIVADRTEYMDFGAGLPHNPEAGQHMRLRNGKLVIDNIGRVLPELAIRVGRVAGHTLLLPKDGKFDLAEEIPLASLARPGSAIYFRIK